MTAREGSTLVPLGSLSIAAMADVVSAPKTLHFHLSCAGLRSKIELIKQPWTPTAPAVVRAGLSHLVRPHAARLARHPAVV